MQDLRESIRWKNVIWVTDLFQKESEMRNRNSDHQIAFIATQNVC